MSRIVKIKLEENRQLVDCLLLKAPSQAVEFKLLYSKARPQEKTKKINKGTHLGWAKILSNNQFISYVHVLYNRPSTDDPNSPPPSTEDEFTPRQEAHELPHLLCTQYFKDVSLSTLVKTNNIKPPKPNTDSAALQNLQRLPIVPSYIYAQKRLFVKWRYEITVWWSRHRDRLQTKFGKYLTLLQQFHRAYPEFRSVQTGKQWFFQVMKQFEQDRGKSISIQDRLQDYQKELKMATEGVRKNAEFVAPTQQRRIDEIRDEYKQRAATTSQKSIQQYMNSSSDSDSSSSSDDSDDSSSDDDSDDEDGKQPADSTMDDSDSSSSSSEDEDPTPPQQTLKPQTKQQQKPQLPQDDSDASSSDEEDHVPSPPSKSTKQPTSKSIKQLPTKKSIPTTKSKAFSASGPTKRKNFGSSSDSSDDDEDNTPKRTVVKKQRH